ncbi:MAG TPA: hypothetical protein VF164_07100 [Trueperaceae bacterium]
MAIVLVVTLALTVSLLLAPIEALGWWAGWFGEAGHDVVYDRPRQGGKPRLHVIYLDGIAKAGHVNYQDVQGFLERLGRELPEAVVLGDVLPYSPSGRGLTERRPLAAFWRRMLELKLQGRQPLLTFSINVRNLLQVLVASDRRYAAVYGRAAAVAMTDALLKGGYRPGSGEPVALIGYSGGAQVALVATPYLKRALDAPLALVSLAGVMASEPGMLSLEGIFHIESSRDRIPAMGRIAFPGNWRIWPRSYLARLRKRGGLVTVDPGPMRHNGVESYLDDASFIGGRSHQEITSRLVSGYLREWIDSAGQKTVTAPHMRVKS